jgi:CBS domain-containing protein
MAFWHYHTDVTTDHSIQPLDPARRSLNVDPKVATSKRQHRPPVAGDPGTGIAAYKHQQQHGNQLKLAVRAEQIMSAPVVSIAPNTSTGEARRIVNQRRFRHVPVVAKDGGILGIVSDRDLFALSSQDETQASAQPDVVATIMTRSVITATADTNIREIARVLFEERIGCMPIVDEKDQVMDIITRSDILRALIKGAPIDLWI